MKKYTQAQAFLGGISFETFFKEFWQKKPLFVKNAFPKFKDPLEPDELAGLACEAEIPSRLIIATQDNNSSYYDLKTGPFNEQEFAKLPDEQWTLLINDLEKFLPETQTILTPFLFIPEWRFEDLQASFCSCNSTLGAQIESHDAFLIQGQGSKIWKVGQTKSIDPQLYSDKQSYPILEGFEEAASFSANAGDLLYLPAHTPYQELSIEDSLTWSLAYKALKHIEIVQDFSDSLLEFIAPDLQFQDTELVNKDNLAEISDEAIEQIQQIIQENLSFDREVIGDWFGRYLTQYKVGQEPEIPEEDFNHQDLQDLLSVPNIIIERYLGTSFFYRETVSEIILYAGGEIHALSKNLKKLVLLLCSHKQFVSNKLSIYLKNQEALEFLLALFNSGNLNFYNADDDHEHDEHCGCDDH